MDPIEKAQDAAKSAPEVAEAKKVVDDAAKALFEAPEEEKEEKKKALDAAVHAHATAMSDALITALLKVEGGRRKTRRGRKVRRTRKSRR